MEVNGTVMENLYPALTECFAIILCGYVAGRINLITETEAKGINTFVGTFSLPSLIFMSLAQLDLHTVNWLFLLSILVSKSLVFFSVMLVTLLVGRPVNFSRAGLFAIFCTQSNDFAIGYPIVAALYKQSHPDYASYLYLMAPISLAILNPIAFVLMELGRRRGGERRDDGDVAKWRVMALVTRNIATNPIVAMTVLGIVGNFLFAHRVPCYLGQVLDALGSAFSASALFLLGLRMVGKVHKLRGAMLVIPGILIMVKLLALPLVIREVVSLVKPGSNASENVDLSTYGFLYGTFPAAPTVFVFATQYVIDVDLVASAMVACTFISAPLMFVSAKMITLSSTTPSDYLRQLDSFTLTVSIVACIACVWVAVVFVVTKRIRRLPHKITACLIVAQLLSCTGAILWNILPQKSGWAGYIQFLIFSTGVYGSRLWSAILAVALLFLQCRNMCYVVKLQPYFVAVGWGVPLLLTSFLLIFEVKTHGAPTADTNSNFVYGTAQAIVSVTLLVFCFVVTVGCLILQERHRRRHSRYTNLDGDDEHVYSAPTTPAPLPVNGRTLGTAHLPTIDETSPASSSSTSSSLTTAGDIEDLFARTDGGGRCGRGDKCARTEDCQRLVADTDDDDLEHIERETDEHDAQLLRHTVLLIMLLCSMFVGVALCIWTVVKDQLSGIYVELSFLDVTLNFGQSLLVLAVFGLDTKELVLPVARLYRRWCRLGCRQGDALLVLPPVARLPIETRHVCDQFVAHHLSNCRDAIATTKRHRLRAYSGVFTGARLVDWLVEVGVARDRGEAVAYARHLVDGRVLRHINGAYHFYDRPLLYTFDGEN